MCFAKNSSISRIEAISQLVLSSSLIWFLSIHVNDFQYGIKYGIDFPNTFFRHDKWNLLKLVVEQQKTRNSISRCKEKAFSLSFAFIEPPLLVVPLVSHVVVENLFLLLKSVTPLCKLRWDLNANWESTRELILPECSGGIAVCNRRKQQKRKQPEGVKYVAEIKTDSAK